MKIDVDVFETTVLIQAAWPDGTILRSMMMQRAINEWFYLLRPKDATAVFEWFKKHAEIKTVNHRIFMLRYDPDNQYSVEATDEKGVRTIQQAFKMNTNYYVRDNSYISPEFITNATKIEP